MINLSPQEAYNELSYYTLSHSSTGFIHQLIVDAFAAQTADKNTKPIKITFALVGLYLVVEKGFTGKQVQLAHMKLARNRKEWLTFTLPENRDNITVFDVLSKSPGKQRDEMIHKWCDAVWETYKDSQQQVRDFVKKELGI